MHVIHLTQFGPPEVLVSEEVACPLPGSGEVSIRNEAVGVNFRDTWIRSGAVPAPQGGSLPLVLGNEVGGTVTEVGEGVPVSITGRKVVASTGGSGGYAAYSVARAEDLVAVPTGVAIADATAMFVQGRVALGAFKAAQINPDDRVLILGASGGVGTLLTQLASQSGCSQIIGASGTRAKTALTQSLGATDTAEYRDNSFSHLLDEIASEGVDVVFDGIGGDVAQTAFGHLSTGKGRHVVYGYSSGTPLHVEASTLVPRGLKVLGFGGQATVPGVQTALAQESLNLLAKGVLQPIIGQQFPLSAAAEAHQAIEARETTGKSLLIPAA